MFLSSHFVMKNNFIILVLKGMFVEMIDELHNKIMKSYDEVKFNTMIQYSSKSKDSCREKSCT